MTSELRGAAGLAGHPWFDRIAAADPVGFSAVVQTAGAAAAPGVPGVSAQLSRLSACTLERVGEIDPARPAAPLLVAVADNGSRLRATPDGIDIDCAAGRLVLLADGVPFAWTFPAGTTLATVRPPAGMLSEPWNRSAGIGAEALPDTSLNRATAGFIRQFVVDAVGSRRESDSAGPRADAAVGTLIDALLRRHGEDPLAGGRLRAAAAAVIDREYAHPELSVDRIAEALAISRRTLYRGFADGGPTLAELITERRLDQARRLLTLADARDLDEIARSCGFGSVGTLRRRFVERYGLTPQQYRTRQRIHVAGNGEPDPPRRPLRPARPVADPYELL